VEGTRKEQKGIGIVKNGEHRQKADQVTNNPIILKVVGRRSDYSVVGRALLKKKAVNKAGIHGKGEGFSTRGSKCVL